MPLLPLPNFKYSTHKNTFLGRRATGLNSRVFSSFITTQHTLYHTIRMADSTQKEQKKKPIIILGAGLAGSLLSCFMVQRGFTVEMYERRADMRKTEMSAGRSINLAMSERGLNALSQVGLREDILKIAIPMKGRMMHAIDGKMTFQPYSKDMKSAIYSISRGQLNCLMMDLAEKNPNIHIHFNYKTTDVNLKTGQVTLKHEQSKEIKQIEGETIFGTDGAFSVTRGCMMKQPRFNYSQDYLEHGYKELTIPPDENGKHRLDSNCLHIWPRGGYMMIALPNLDGSFTVTCFFPHDEGEASFARLDNADDQTILDFFKKIFPDALTVMPTLLHDWRTNPTSVLVTIRCKPWYIEDKCCLLGDACHAIVPFFGQGMNAAFEDCAVLNECINEFGTEWKKVFAKYQDLRKENADAIATMALENFVEMRDKVADPHFLFKKKVEHKLGNTFPTKFLSRYEMVSFTTHPYKEALRRGLLNDKICSELMQGIDDMDAEKIDLKKAEQLINKYLS